MSCHPQDEAAELVAIEGQGSRAGPEEGLAYLAQHCELAVVTLGDKGCIAHKRGEAGAVQEPACSGVTVVDATGSFANFPALRLPLDVVLSGRCRSLCAQTPLQSFPSKLIAVRVLTESV